MARARHSFPSLNKDNGRFAMSVIASLAGALLAQAALVAAPPEPSVQTVDVAYA